MSAILRAVSLYSLQDQYARGKMNLNQIFDFVEELGCDGIELISDQMMHNTPHPDESTLKEWDHIVATHNLKPVVNDIFINTNVYRNRDMTRKEKVKALIEEIELAYRLGFSMVRLVCQTPPDVIEPALAVAEKRHIIITAEIHGGFSYKSLNAMGYIKLMKELKSPIVGIVVDTSMFCRKHPRQIVKYLSSLGPLNPELIAYIDSIYAKGSHPMHEYCDDQGVPIYTDKIKSIVKSDVDKFYLSNAGLCENHPMQILDDLLPYVKHFHGKFFEMTDEGIEYSIPYDEIIKYLDDKKWAGYIASEYEGQRYIPLNEEVDEPGQLRKHQALLKKLIGR
jgi:sugar phosphate isomerase/epimerase